MIEHLRRHGFNDIILAACYLPDSIREHFGGGGDFGVRLTYEVEATPLGTAGAVKNVERHLDSTCAIFNGDVLTDMDLTAMLRLHREAGAKVTIALTPVEDPTIYGVVETDLDGRVRQFVEKPTWDAVTTNMINAGAYMLEPEVLDFVPHGQPFMFERGLFPMLLQLNEPVYGYPSQSYWIDIGTPEKYLTAHQDLLLGKMSVPFSGRQVSPGVWVEPGCKIDPTAQLTGPVVMGRECVVGPNARLTGPLVLSNGCVVDPDASVEDAVLWEKARARSQAVLRSCVIGRSCDVGEECWITEGAVLGDRVVVGRGNRLERGIRLWPEKNIPANSISF
jgi:mannose-1-phosphate guanylyltransferase